MKTATFSIQHDEVIQRAVEAADNADPQNFKHSEVRHLRKGFRRLLRQHETAVAWAERSTVEEF